MYLQATIISASSSISASNLKPLEFNNKTAFNRSGILLHIVSQRSGNYVQGVLCRIY